MARVNHSAGRYCLLDLASLLMEVTGKPVYDLKPPQRVAKQGAHYLIGPLEVDEGFDLACDFHHWRVGIQCWTDEGTQGAVLDMKEYAEEVAEKLGWYVDSGRTLLSKADNWVGYEVVIDKEVRR